jgi:hypothetical protein
MDTTLVSVTLLSMTMAAALSVIVWRMLRDERYRTDARVTALTTMAAHAATRERAERGLQGSPRGVSAGGTHPLTIELPLYERTGRGLQGPPRGVSAGGTHPLDNDGPVATTADLFTEPLRSSPWGHRFAVMAGLGLIVASVILLALTSSGRKAPARHAPSANTAATAAGQTPGRSDPAREAGLELLSLRDSRQPGALTITGLVQNPRGGAPLSHVAVTAYAFDDKGAFLASGRALIDVTALAPGDESPFVVSVPVTETVARYRIGFRDEDGRVIAHVDRRQQSPVAANW